MKGLIVSGGRGRPAAQILLVRAPDPQMPGVVELGNGRVVRLAEKPQQPEAWLCHDRQADIFACVTTWPSWC